jgi:hypothetical protein
VPSTTSSELLKIEPAIMASEIERLPDLEGFLKLASIPDWQSVKLTPRSEPPPARPRRPVVVATAITPDPEARPADEPNARRDKPRPAPTRARQAKAGGRAPVRSGKAPAAAPPEANTPAEDDAAVQSRAGEAELRN